MSVAPSSAPVSEAVQAAMRLARTATGRDKIAVFTKDYHGNFDEVLLRGSQAKKKPRTFPSAPGVPKSAVSNMLVLDYGTEESMEILKEHAHELAAIMIEPVQSRRPEFQPMEFVKELRTLADDNGALLIFDEVICGTPATAPTARKDSTASNPRHLHLR